eukprot:1184257-Prorocentrum_minimum.AAC.1
MCGWGGGYFGVACRLPPLPPPPLAIPGARWTLLRTRSHAQGTREPIPGVGTNRRGLEGIFQGLEPIAGD